MYSYVMLAALLLFTANARYFDRDDQGFDKRGIAEIVLCGMLLGYAHALGIVFVACVQAAFFFAYFRDRKFWPWVVASVLAGLLILPAAAFAAAHKLKHAVVPSFADLLHGLSIFSLGTGDLTLPVLLIGSLLFTVLAGTSIAAGSSRTSPTYLRGPFIAGLIVGTIAFAFLISRIAFAIWIDLRTFAFLAPFWAMAIGLLAHRYFEARRYPLLAALVLVGLGTLAGLVGMVSDQKPDDWRAVVDAYRRDRQPGDRIVMGNDRERWSFNYYYFGRDWQRGYRSDWPALLAQVRHKTLPVSQLDDRMSAVDRSLSARDGLAVLTIEDAAALPPSGGRTWFVTESWNCGKPVPAAFGQVIKNYDVHGMCMTLRGA